MVFPAKGGDFAVGNFKLAALHSFFPFQGMVKL
jgi:hypothetical protein